MHWQLRGVLVRWKMASDCLFLLQKHTYFHDYSPVVCTWRLSVFVCVCGVCIFTLTQREEKREEKRGREERGGQSGQKKVMILRITYVRCKLQKLNSSWFQQ